MDDLISDFLAETNESLAKLDVELVRLEQNPEDKDLLGSIFRIMHTIKGTCGFLGLAKLETVAHASENILDKVRNAEIKVSPERISIILESIDMIKILVKALESTGSEPEGQDVSDLIKRLNAATIDGPSAEAVPSPATDAAPKPATEEKPAEAPAASLDEAKTEDKATFVDVINDIENLMTKKDEAAKKAEQFKHETEELQKKNEKKPAANAKDANAKNAPQAATQTIRVSLDSLEGLMQTVSELVLARNQLLQISRRNQDSEFTMPLQRLNHITSELQERVMKTRMQPIGNAWAQFPRIIRDLAVELGKKIELVMIGEDTELDRQLIESIKDPLTHMVRNSADHGVEKPDERKMAGKSEVGKITLKAYHQGGHIIIEITDDGKGLHIDKIKKKILDNGLATQQEIDSMTDQQIQQYIFRAGFSTAEKITSVSGRGVGMDVVKTNIEKISGTVELNSVYGKGSTFTIKIPLTLAIMPILIVECNGGKFGIPQITITEMVKGGGKLEHKIENLDDRLIIRLRNSLLPLVPLNDVLYPHVKQKIDENKEYFVVVCQVGSFSFGIIVDKIYDTEEIVVKPVSPIIKHIHVYSGCTLLGDGSVIMILDPTGLLKYLSESQSNSDNNFINRDRSMLGDSEDAKKKAGFLVFKAGGNTPKAVPLDFIARLEEVDVTKLETSINKTVLQYRNHLMRITKLETDYEIAKEGIQQVIVFIDKEKYLGLAVEDILDIVEAKVDIITPISADGFIGSFVTEGKTVDIIDISYFFHNTFSDEAETEMKMVTNLHKKVLLVDDSAFFRKFIPPIVNKLGYDVITAETAQIAMKTLEQETNIVGIITDINMPGMSGIEFGMACKSNEKLKSIPIIALSANYSNAGIDINNSGIDAYVSKTNHEELVSAINKLLTGK